MRWADILSGVIGGSAPLSAGSVSIARVDDGAQIASGLTDDEGLCDVTANGAHGEVIITIRKGGNTFVVDSRSLTRTGQVWWSLFRTVMKATHGNGVIPAYAYGSEFQATNQGTTLLIGTGGCLLDGVLAMWYSNTTITPGANGDRATVAALSGSGVVQLVDVAYSAIDSTIHVPLWRYTVTAGAITNVVSLSSPILKGIRNKHQVQASAAMLASGSTSNASGEDSGLGTTLTLENGVTYQVIGKAAATSRARDGAIAVQINGNTGSYKSADGDSTQLLTASHMQTVVGSGAAISVKMFERSDTALTDWALQATYGSFGAGTSPNFSSPAQVAVDGSGNIYVADTGNSRIVKLNSSGAYVSSITGFGFLGVAVDASGNIYGAFSGTLKKYNSSGVLQWSVNFGSNLWHIATDDTRVYLVDQSGNLIWKRLCSDGSAVTSWGSLGAGNGQFNSPRGICYYNSEVYVVDAGNSRVQVFDTGGVYQRQWTVPAGCRGINVDSSGHIVVACNTGNTVYRYTTTGTAVDSFVQATPHGIVVTSGDVIWVSNSGSHNVAKWDEAAAGFSWDNGILLALAIPRT